MTSRLVGRACAAIVILALSPTLTADEPVAPAAARAELDRLIASAPLDPTTLRARLAYAAALSNSEQGECLQNTRSAEEQLQAIIDAPAHALVMTPDLAPIALGVLANTRLTRAICTEDDAAATELLESAIETARRAAPQLQATREYADLSANQFNIAYAFREIGDTEVAFEELHQAIALNERFGQRDDQIENYRTMLEWQSPDGEIDESHVDRYAASLETSNVKFQFGWTPFDATVTTSTTHDTWRNEQRRTTSTNFVADLSVRAEGDDLVMSTRIRDGDLAAGTSDSRLDLAVLLQRQSRKLPATTISRSGEIKSLGDVDAFVAGLTDELVAAAGTDPALNHAKALTPDEVRALAARMLRSDLIESSMRDDWETEVGTWLGAELEHGAWYELEFAAPAFGGESQPIRNRLRFSVTRFMPCEPQAAEPRCVEIVMHNEPDEESVRAATSALRTDVLPKQTGVQDSLQAAVGAIQQVEIHTRLITDPGTLRPYLREQVRLARAAVDENGKRNVIVRRDERVERTTYRAATGP